jgi:hypothetical protein
MNPHRTILGCLLVAWCLRCGDSPKAHIDPASMPPAKFASAPPPPALFTVKPPGEAAWKHEPIDFHGVPWDSSLGSAKQVLHMNCGGWNGQFCSKDRFLIGSVDTKLSVNFESPAGSQPNDGRLCTISLEFSPSSFKKVKGVFFEKYGEPTTTEKQDGLPSYTWRGSAVTVNLEQGDPSQNETAGAIFRVNACWNYKKTTSQAERSSRERKDADADKHAAKDF